MQIYPFKDSKELKKRDRNQNREFPEGVKIFKFPRENLMRRIVEIDAEIIKMITSIKVNQTISKKQSYEKQ